LAQVSPEQKYSSHPHSLSLRAPMQSGRGNPAQLNKLNQPNELNKPNKLNTLGVLTNLTPDSRLLTSFN
jgi:hypothetical protein